eukprot:CAMPEP_0113303386 /NCGR_PEP_ID=MMETSP0010_2-20120614/3825_1 /TAXON_ID=216773 ORGANISM="Corethron hystrix, Strain 308" /NCGR_SAMPLE_ID=MMETSP0010_2 /ASSEMBLY_ACC=CAM_ASM_000155 /LENGTH=798 /DNA_ID=CAMNT_0000157377 /DNA_START=64 /DNA_END=2460 /DNA_ORIENTATION=+ /assembly_acc=CAM_ASM_000155
MESVPIAAAGHGQRKKVLLMDYRKFRSQQQQQAVAGGSGKPLPPAATDGEGGARIGVGAFVANSFGAFDRSIGIVPSGEEIDDDTSEDGGASLLPSFPLAVASFALQECLKWSLFCYVLVKALMVGSFRVASHFALQFYVASFPEPLRDQMDELAQNAPALTALGTMTLMAFFMHPEGLTWVLLGKIREYIHQILKSARLCLVMIMERRVPTAAASGSMVALICFSVLVLSSNYSPPPTTKMGNVERSKSRTCKGRKKKKNKHHDCRAKHNGSGSSGGCKEQERPSSSPPSLFKKFFSFPTWVPRWSCRSSSSKLSKISISSSTGSGSTGGKLRESSCRNKDSSSLTSSNHSAKHIKSFSSDVPSDVPGRKTSYDSFDDASMSTAATNSQDQVVSKSSATDGTNVKKVPISSSKKSTTSSTSTKSSSVVGITIDPICEKGKNGVKVKHSSTSDQRSARLPQQPHRSPSKENRKAHFNGNSPPAVTSREVHKQRRGDHQGNKHCTSSNNRAIHVPHTQNSPKSSLKNSRHRTNQRPARKTPTHPTIEPIPSLPESHPSPRPERPSAAVRKGPRYTLAMENRYTPGKIELANVLAQVGLVGADCAHILAEVPDVASLTCMSPAEYGRYSIGPEVHGRIRAVFHARRAKEAEMAERLQRERAAASFVSAESLPLPASAKIPFGFAPAPVLRPPPGLTDVTIGGRDIYDGRAAPGGIGNNGYQPFGDNRCQVLQLVHPGVISPPKKSLLHVASTWNQNEVPLFENGDQNHPPTMFGMEDDTSKIEADLHELGDQMAISILDF